MIQLYTETDYPCHHTLTAQGRGPASGMSSWAAAR